MLLKNLVHTIGSYHFVFIVTRSRYSESQTRTHDPAITITSDNLRYLITTIAVAHVSSPVKAIYIYKFSKAKDNAEFTSVITQCSTRDMDMLN